MELLAFLTLNILVFSSIISTSNHLNMVHFNSNDHSNQAAMQKSSPKIDNEVLGSYVTVYSAVSGYSENKNIVTTITPTPKTEDDSSNLPTPTPNSESSEQALEEQETVAEIVVEENDNITIESGDNATLLMEKINSYRQANGLSAFSYDRSVCDFAFLRAQELVNDFSHTGFRSRIDSNQLPYPDYSHVAENIADTVTFEKAFELWKNSSTHNQNMLSADLYGCVGNTGRLYTLQTWNP